MGRYNDVIQFLAAHEDVNNSQQNERVRLTNAEAQDLRRNHPGIPDDYIDYLTEIGWGSFRESQYMVYSGLIDPHEIFDADTVASFKKPLLFFGETKARQRQTRTFLTSC